MPISKEQARELAEKFRNVSVAVGDYRFAHWGALTPAQRQQLADEEWTLLNNSNDFITKAVGLALDDVEGDLKVISGATEKARKVLKSIQDVKNVIRIAAAMVAMGGAIVAAVGSENPAPVLAAAGDLVATLKDVASQES